VSLLIQSLTLAQKFKNEINTKYYYKVVIPSSAISGETRWLSVSTAVMWGMVDMLCGCERFYWSAGCILLGRASAALLHYELHPEICQILLYDA